MDYVKVIIK